MMVTPQPELLDTVLRYLDHTDAGLHVQYCKTSFAAPLKHVFKRITCGE